MNDLNAPAAPIRVFLVDDHRVVRTGLAAYLAQIADIEVVAEASDGQQAMDRLAALEPTGGVPDVVLMDLLMPVLDGIAATRAIKARWPSIEIVAMTSFVEESKVRDALEAGAAGYLLKDADADEVSAAIRSALAGRMHLDPTVARLLAEGASNQGIADALVVSERTARNHVSAILAKLDLASRTQAALWAVREGITRDSGDPGRAGATSSE